MIVDIKDIDHVYHEIINEIPALLEKRKLMRSKIAKQVKTKAPYQIRNFATYKRPGGNITWTIYFDILKGCKVEDAEFLFICSVETKKRKVFINLNARVKGIAPPKDFLRIYDIHFLERFKKRCSIKAKSHEEMLAIFLYDGEISVFNNWDNESNEMRYINHWGFSLGRYDEKNRITYFDTFVRKDSLFGDQKKWVSELLNDAIKDNNYKSNILMYQYWYNFMDDEIMIENIIKQTKKPENFSVTEWEVEIKKYLASLKENAKWGNN